VRLDRGGRLLGGPGGWRSVRCDHRGGSDCTIKAAIGEERAYRSSTLVDMFQHCSKIRESELSLSRVKPRKIRNKKVDSANSTQKSVLLEDRPANDARKSETDLVWTRFGVSVTHFCSL